MAPMAPDACLVGSSRAKLHAARLRDAREHVDRLPHQLAQLDAFKLGRGQFRLRLREQQQLIHQRFQRTALFNDVDHEILILLGRPLAVECYLDGAANRRQRRAQLMRGVSQKVSLDVQIRGDPVEQRVDRFRQEIELVAGPANR